MDSQFSKVRLLKEVPEHGLSVGETGYIVDVYTQPNDAYEVEFLDDKGRTIEVIPLEPEDLELVENSPPSEPSPG